MKRIGLMGCGTVAGYGHLPALQQVEGLELISIYDPHAGRLRQAQERFGVRQAFTEAEPFFASGIEAVTITSPAPGHRENVLEAVRHGKHVLCEKPLALHERDCEEMIRAARGQGRQLYTAFTYRFSPVARRIRELVQARAVGDVRSLRLIYLWNCHGKFRTDESGKRVIQERREGRMLEGGPLVDCGTHDLDLARWWLGSEVVRFTGHGAWVEEYEAPDHMWLHLDHACGAHTMVEISYSYCHTAREPRSELVFELIGTAGLIRYEMQTSSLKVYGTEGTQEYPVDSGKQFAAMYEEFARALETGSSEFLATAEDGREAIRLSRLATEQAIRDRPRSARPSA